MNGSTSDRSRISPRGQPVWEIAELFPEQGSWTEQGYLALQTNRLVEFDNGVIEILPSATKTHQRIPGFLCLRLHAFVAGNGRVLIAAYPLRIPNGRFRTPDVLWLTREQDAAAREEFAEAAELVIEIVNPDDRERDYVTKRADYAAARVAEYWIVDPAAAQVLVLRLEGGTYVEHGRFGRGERATSHRLPGLGVAVDDVLAQGR
jgi:Uma2 family endonuclease